MNGIECGCSELEFCQECDPVLYDRLEERGIVVTGNPLKDMHGNVTWASIMGFMKRYNAG